MRSTTRSRKGRIIVMGLVVRIPLGGMAWHYLQYCLGLRSLGFDVVYVEDSDDYPACYDPSRFVTERDPSYGLEFARRAFDRLQLHEAWSYFDAHQGVWHGPLGGLGYAVFDEADVIVNISHLNPLRDWAMHVPYRVAIDTDPVFSQIRSITDPAWRAFVANHTHFFTFGERVSASDCLMPDDGIRWLPTRQPIALDAWPVTRASPEGRFTTVMQWDAYPPREHRGQRFGMKSDSFTDFLDLPKMVNGELEIALGSPHAPRDVLREHGWLLRDPIQITRDPWTYQDYIRQSKAEFSVSKHGYVVSKCGWFSERSANYLASGRPVIAQETGFSHTIPTGEGLFAFSNAEEAAAAVERVNLDLEGQQKAARDLAEAYFGADTVLGPLVAQVLR